MPAAELVVGQIALVGRAEGDDERERLRGPVERVFEGSVTVRLLEGEHMPLGLDNGVAVTVTYFERFGLYSYPAKVSLRDENRLVVERTGPTEEVQRRQFVRLSEPVPVECLTVDDVTGKLFSLTATTVNVSGGGLAIQAERLTPPNTRVVVALSPKGTPPILAVGSVIASERTEPGAAKVVTRVTFAAIAEGDRERLIKYVFENLR